MKVITLGDIHGNDIWEKVKDETFDLLIFLGDYVDSYTHTNVEILHNLNNIIRFKQDFPDNVILLIGNHDVQYMEGYGYSKYGCTGYRPKMQWDLQDLFKTNKDLFQMAYQIETPFSGKYLWTHAGLTRPWKDDFIFEYEQSMFTDDYIDINLASKLNVAFDIQLPSLFRVGFKRGGIDRFGGPLWADAEETMSKRFALNDFHQIIGHTRMDQINTIRFDSTTSVTYVDCLDNGLKYHVLNY